MSGDKVSAGYRLRVCDLLVLAAHPAELAPLRQVLGGADAGVYRKVRLGTATVGVGLWQAAAGTAEALQAWDCRAAVLVGSYGFLPGTGAKVLDVLVPAQVRLLDVNLLRGCSALPDFVPTVARLDGGLTADLQESAPGALTGDLGTSLAITTEDALAAELAQLGQLTSPCLGENLEALAVAHACSTAGVPLGAVLVATNEVGSQGRTQWLMHHGQAAELTAAILRTFCERGGLVHGGAGDTH